MPWIAATIMPAFAIDLLTGNNSATMLHWVGDFERVLAFSFSSYMNSKYS
jgi:hypothetical protein